MDQRDSRLARWREAVVALNAEHNWGLSADEIEGYIFALDKLLPETSAESELYRVCGFYHADHQIVEALRSQVHPCHCERWEIWMRKADKILRKSDLHWSSDNAVTSDDLAQVAQVALVSALPNFAYRSSFGTWAHTVVVQSVCRYLRDSHAKKRAQRPDSLDAAPGLAVLACEEDEPEQQVAINVLIDQIRTILFQQGDKRLAQIFHLWAVDDLATEEIGKCVHLHPSRVRALLAQARTLLQRHPIIQAWLVDIDPISRAEDYQVSTIS